MMRTAAIALSLVPSLSRRPAPPPRGPAARAPLLLPPPAGRPAPPRATTAPPTEVGLALAAAGPDLCHTPAKSLTAAIGLPIGALIGFLTVGSVRAAYAI